MSSLMCAWGFFGLFLAELVRQFPPDNIAWHQWINTRCSKSKNKKITLSASPFLARVYQKSCSMTGIPITFMSKASNTFKGNLTISDNLANNASCRVMIFRVSSKSTALAEHTEHAKKNTLHVLNLKGAQYIQILDPTANFRPVLWRLVFVHMPFPSWQQVLHQPDRMFLDVRGIP